jgi:hypothetical protein
MTQENVPTPDEVDTWASGPRKREGRLRRLFARKTIEMGAGVGEAATKASLSSRAEEVHETGEGSTEALLYQSGAKAGPHPRRIEFAAGVLERGAVDAVEAPQVQSDTQPETELAPLQSSAQPPVVAKVAIPLPMQQAASLDRGVDTGSLVIEAAGFSLFATEEKRREPGPTPSEEDVGGSARIYRIAGPEAIALELGDIAWDNGERSVMLLDRMNPPSKFDGLVRRLRMSVTPIDAHEAVVELSVARFNQPNRPSLVQADVRKVGSEIGVDIIQSLTSAGARQVGTKEQVLGVQHNRRGYWCAVFADTNPHVPAVAFLLLRIIPVHLELHA